ncbi:MAG: outer membrane beta-barrel domain-containing protein [Deltaproteobacteria bacterium]|nr:outer membrane beta-barrel domain-containing protein [Deltaproteobacteria bacterium]
MKKGKVIVGIVVLAAVACWSAAPLLAEEKSQLDSYLDKYWGEQRKVKVIQKRLFQKQGRFSLTPYFGVIPNDEFFNYVPLGLRAAYYFSEDLAVELFGSYIFNTKSDLEEFLNKEFFIKTTTPQVLQWNAGLEGLWSPIHGKVGLFSKKLWHFDLHLAFGAGAIGTIVRTRKEGGAEKARVDVGGNIGLGAQMYVVSWGAVRVEYRHFFYAATKEVGGVSFPAEITFGFNFYLN